MTDFERFSKRCKMRHDVGDQLQVRYVNGNEEHYDTWVSGAEALQRLDSIEAEEQIRALGKLNLVDLRLVIQSLPESTARMVRRSMRDELADRLEEGIGGNLIGSALADAVRGRSKTTDSSVSEKDRWQALMRYEPFRRQVLELAWIQLEGSFPDVDSAAQPNDWL